MSERIEPLDASISIGDGEKDAPGDDESFLRSQSLFSAGKVLDAFVFLRAMGSCCCYSV